MGKQRGRRRSTAGEQAARGGATDFGERRNHSGNRLLQNNKEAEIAVREWLQMRVTFHNETLSNCKASCLLFARTFQSVSHRVLLFDTVKKRRRKDVDKQEAVTYYRSAFVKVSAFCRYDAFIWRKNTANYDSEVTKYFFCVKVSIYKVTSSSFRSWRFNGWR